MSSNALFNVLDQDSLLVILGDRGMDRKGDHGGNGDLEVFERFCLIRQGCANVPSPSQNLSWGTISTPFDTPDCSSANSLTPRTPDPFQQSQKR